MSPANRSLACSTSVSRICPRADSANRCQPLALTSLSIATTTTSTLKRTVSIAMNSVAPNWAALTVDSPAKNSSRQSDTLAGRSSTQKSPTVTRSPVASAVSVYVNSRGGVRPKHSLGSFPSTIWLKCFVRRSASARSIAAQRSRAGAPPSSRLFCRKLEAGIEGMPWSRKASRPREVSQ